MIFNREQWWRSGFPLKQRHNERAHGGGCSRHHNPAGTAAISNAIERPLVMFGGGDRFPPIDTSTAAICNYRSAQKAVIPRRRVKLAQSRPSGINSVHSRLGTSLMSLKEKLIKIGAKVVSHGPYVAFQMAEVAIPRNLFADILRLIAELRPPPVTSTEESASLGAPPRAGPPRTGSQRHFILVKALPWTQFGVGKAVIWRMSEVFSQRSDALRRFLIERGPVRKIHLLRPGCIRRTHSNRASVLPPLGLATNRDPLSQARCKLRRC
jgi:hypothetical protein